MEGRMIIVKNLPSCSQDTIENYLEVVCDNGVQHIQFYDERVKHIAMVTMEEDIEDIESYRKRVKNRKLEGNTVELLAVAPPSGVLVTDLPSDITQDTITYYFENRRSGGEDDAVKDCKYYKDLGLATVVFMDKDVVQRVLNVTTHTPKRKEPPVTVQPYYPEFHVYVLDFLVNLESCDQLLGEFNSPFNENKPESSCVDREVPVKSILSSTDKIQMLDGQRIQEISKFPQSHHMVSAQVCAVNQTKEITKLLEHEIIEEPMLLDERHQTSKAPFPHKPSPKPKTSPNALHPAVEEKIGQAFINLSPYNIKLLKVSHNIDSEFPMCKLTYKVDSGTIDMEGPETKLQELKLRVFEENHKISSASHLVPQTIADILKKEKGRTYLDKEVKGHNSVWYLDGNTFHCNLRHIRHR